MCSLHRVALAVLLFTLTFVGVAGSVNAAVLRYALIIGNNVGVDEHGTAQPELQRAELEAARLSLALQDCCGFSASPRMLLVTGATRAEFHAAVAQIRAQIDADKRALPDARVLFTFFYSGHGSRGSLLLHDGPLAARELLERHALHDASPRTAASTPTTT